MGSTFILFDTPLGRAGIAWSDRGITRIQLPESDERATIRRLGNGDPAPLPARPPAWVARAMRKIQGHLGGKPEDLAELRLDMESIPPFHRRIYEALRGVGPGRTVTYGELARLAGSPAAARAVGQAMARNPFVLAVPCHRVLGAGGGLGGFSAFGGAATKERLLAVEGGTPRPPLFRGSGGLSFDAAEAVRALGRADPDLRRLMARVGPFGLKPQGLQTPYEALAEAIVYQQLTGKAAATIFGRLEALGRHGRFPAPRELLRKGDGALRAAGVSRGKVLALRDLAAKTLAGEVPSLGVLRRLEDEEIVRRLDPIRGIGRWTVEMLLIFRLGRPDVLPADDYGLRKGFARAFGTRRLPSPSQVLRRGERWRPYRTVASWYLWRACEE